MKKNITLYKITGHKINFHSITKMLFLSCLLLGFSACRKELITQLRPVDITIMVDFDPAAAALNLPVSGLEVRLKSLETGVETVMKTNEKGAVVFPGISSGSYDFMVSRKFNPAEYKQLTGIEEKKEVVYNAGTSNFSIKTNTGAYTIPMTLKRGVMGDWVIKQLYYAGSDLYDGASLRDNFFEIYNNTDQVLYADKLCMMFVYGRLSTTYRLPDLLQPNGQFDWTKSVGTEPAPANANEDYLYAQAIYQFPGKGTDYPVQPGHGLVVARSAINHQKPFTNKNGKVYEVKNPSLTVDLSNADFEVITAPYLEPGESGSLIDIPTPGKTSLNVIQKFGANMMMDNIGRIAYALFRTEEDMTKWPKYTEVKETTIEGKTLYTRVPKKYIIDAVETQPSTPGRRIPKKLSMELDAGFGFVPGSSYSSQALIRRVEKVENGRRILMDTNNSSVDFEWIQPAIPGGFKN